MITLLSEELVRLNQLIEENLRIGLPLSPEVYREVHALWMGTGTPPTTISIIDT